jgi:hypothetical protein
MAQPEIDLHQEVGADVPRVFHREKNRRIFQNEDANDGRKTGALINAMVTLH